MGCDGAGSVKGSKAQPVWWPSRAALAKQAANCAPFESGSAGEFTQATAQIDRNGAAVEILGLIDNHPGMALSETSWLLARTGAPVERIVFSRRPLQAAAVRNPRGRGFRCLLWVACLVVALPAFADASAAGAPNQPASRKLVVGTKEAPPFAFKLPDGEWTGISIDLWRKVADDLNLDYEIRAFPLEDLITATHQEEVDVAVAAIGMTAQRNNLIEFSYPFFGTGLAMAVKRGETGGLWEFLHRLFIKRLNSHSIKYL